MLDFWCSCSAKSEAASSGSTCDKTSPANCDQDSEALDATAHPISEARVPNDEAHWERQCGMQLALAGCIPNARKRRN